MQSQIAKGKSGGQKFRERQKKQIQELEKVTAKIEAAAEALEAQNAYKKKRLQMLERLLQCRDDQILLMQLSKKGAEEYTSSKAAIKIGPCSYQCIKGMAKDDLVLSWKTFLSRTSLLLMRIPDGSPNSPPPDESSLESARQLDEAVTAIRCLFKHVVVLNPELLHSILSVNLESGLDAVAPYDHWSSVVMKLQLDELQSTMIHEVFEIYLRAMNPIHKERGMIRSTTSEIKSAGSLPSQQLGPPSALSPSVSSPCTSGSVSSPRSTLSTQTPSCSQGITSLSIEMFFQEVDFAEKLAQNVQKEYCNRLLLCCYMFGELLTPVQFAKLVFYSYPFFPDAIAVASMVRDHVNSPKPPPQTRSNPIPMNMEGMIVATPNSLQSSNIFLNILANNNINNNNSSNNSSSVMQRDVFGTCTSLSNQQQTMSHVFNQNSCAVRSLNKTVSSLAAEGGGGLCSMGLGNGGLSNGGVTGGGERRGEGPASILNAPLSYGGLNLLGSGKSPFLADGQWGPIGGAGGSVLDLGVAGGALLSRGGGGMGGGGGGIGGGGIGGGGIGGGGIGGMRGNLNSHISGFENSNSLINPSNDASPAIPFPSSSAHLGLREQTGASSKIDMSYFMRPSTSPHLYEDYGSGCRSLTSTASSSNSAGGVFLRRGGGGGVMNLGGDGKDREVLDREAFDRDDRFGREGSRNLLGNDQPQLESYSVCNRPILNLNNSALEETAFTGLDLAVHGLGVGEMGGKRDGQGLGYCDPSTHHHPNNHYHNHNHNHNQLHHQGSNGLANWDTSSNRSHGNSDHPYRQGMIQNSLGPKFYLKEGGGRDLGFEGGALGMDLANHDNASISSKGVKNAACGNGIGRNDSANYGDAGASNFMTHLGRILDHNHGLALDLGRSDGDPARGGGLKGGRKEGGGSDMEGEGSGGGGGGGGGRNSDLKNQGPSSNSQNNNNNNHPHHHNYHHPHHQQDYRGNHLSSTSSSSAFVGEPRRLNLSLSPMYSASLVGGGGEEGSFGVQFDGSGAALGSLNAGLGRWT